MPRRNRRKKDDEKKNRAARISRRNKIVDKQKKNQSYIDELLRNGATKK